jgi:hypothetical protein
MLVTITSPNPKERANDRATLTPWLALLPKPPLRPHAPPKRVGASISQGAQNLVDPPLPGEQPVRGLAAEGLGQCGEWCQGPLGELGTDTTNEWRLVMLGGARASAARAPSGAQ